MEGCFTFRSWGGVCFSDGGWGVEVGRTSFLKGGAPNGRASVLMMGFSKKS